ncbi:MAG: SPFH domain-containing protein [Oscillospiraceae bacterium]
MGLLRAVATAVGSTLADSWKEFFYCEAMPANVLVVKGQKVIGNKSSNKKGNDNIITKGSGIVVADGQCMVIVDNGKIVEVCAETGEYTYDSSTEASIFSGSLGEGIKETFKTIGRRIGYGGDAGHDQRVYYINIKELINNKFGTQNPVPFRVSYQDIGRSFTAGLRCNGVYSYRIVDPIVFYMNVCGNVSKDFTQADINDQLKAEFLGALQPAFAKLSAMGIRYDEVPLHTMEISQAMDEVLSPAWKKKRGLAIVSVAINSVTMSKEDEDRIKKYEDLAWNANPLNAAATMVGAQAQAMQTAAGNAGGAAMGFYGMNMAQQQGGFNAQNLYAMGAQQQAQQAAQPAPAQNANRWTCSCGTANTGKFCQNCGTPKPAEEGWTCSCGSVNKGKFCPNCGKKKPEGAPLYRCDKCGWTPEDPTHPPKFCPECGDVFDDNDMQ